MNKSTASLTIQLQDSIGRNPTAESDTEKAAPLRPYLQNERQQKDKNPGVWNDG